tara:strand:+ start:84 stop:791 length:708 start_codon:yes stop_codon:yes gene_type:complete
VSDFLSDEEQSERLRNLVGRYGLWVVLVIVLGISAYFFFEYSSEQRRFESENSTALLKQFFDVEDEARSEILQEIETTFPKSSSHILALLTEASSLFEAEQNDEARKLLEKVLSLSPNVLLADLARIRLARVFRDIDDGQGALSALSAVKGAGYRSLALELTGDIYFSEKRIPEAFEAYDRALEALREGERRPLLELKRNSLSPLDGSFAEVEDTLADALRKAEELTRNPESPDE